MAQGPSQGLEAHLGSKLREKLAAIYPQLPAALVRLSAIVNKAACTGLSQADVKRGIAQLRKVLLLIEVQFHQHYSQCLLGCIRDQYGPSLLVSGQMVVCQNRTLI